MATALELQTFADKTSFAIPTLDYAVGLPAGTALKSILTIGTSIPGVTYNAATKVVNVRADNVTLSGYNFSGVSVSVEANNVSIKNSYFDASAGVFSVVQAIGKTGLTVDHSTFDGLKLDRPLADFINGGTGAITVTYNQFLNAPGDAIQIKQGVVDHNYFSGAGYATGAHADAIWIDGSTGKISITNNFIDYRNSSDGRVETTSALAIGNYFGNNADILISQNILLGGTFTVYVKEFGTYSYSKVDVVNNYVGGALFGDLYTGPRPATLSYSQNGQAVPGYTDPAGGPVIGIAPRPLAVPDEVIGTKVYGKAGITEILVGTSLTDWVFGNGDRDEIVGGGGRDFLFGGKGTDIFVYKALSDSTGVKSDFVTGFVSGVDKIDLSALAGSASLNFIGDKAFSGIAGSLHTVKTATTTWVELDANGDKVADLKIELNGLHHLSTSDFILSPGAASSVVLAPAPVVDAPAPAPSPAPAPVPTTVEAGLKVVGKAGISETLVGSSATDWIWGNGDGDRVVGGGGRDFLFSGKGKDIFVYNAISDSAVGKQDAIADFVAGVDKIDLHALAGTGNLSFVGEKAFSGVAGSVHAVKAATSTFVEVDINGDRAADLRVELKGLHSLSAIDFIL